MQNFMDKFNFDVSRVGYVGVECERFIADVATPQKIVPAAPKILALLGERGVPQLRGHPQYYWGSGHDAPMYAEEDIIGYDPPVHGEFSYELSACQLESRTGPCMLGDLDAELHATNSRLRRMLDPYGLRPLYTEVGPEDMCLDVYPDPSGRYQRIVQDMPREILLAACRVIGTHVHVGMRDHSMALRVYNKVIKHYNDLCMWGNGSFGERLAIYRTMAPDADPQPYTDWGDYHRVAQEKGFAEDPRKCWTLIRMSVHGTIEFRMFGATDSLSRIVRWAERCHALCVEAMS